MHVPKNLPFSSFRGVTLGLEFSSLVCSPLDVMKQTFSRYHRQPDRVCQGGCLTFCHYSFYHYFCVWGFWGLGFWVCVWGVCVNQIVKYCLPGLLLPLHCQSHSVAYFIKPSISCSAFQLFQINFSLANSLCNSHVDITDTLHGKPCPLSLCLLGQPSIQIPNFALL